MNKILRKKMHFLKKFAIIAWIISLARESEAFERTRAEFVCSKACTCASEYLSDVPIIKWLTIPMIKKFDKIHRDNNVLNNESEDINLDRNPLVFSAFCSEQDDSSSIKSEEFEPVVQTLTLLYGPDSSNKTIGHELNEFSQLLALDIRGYEPKSRSTYEYSDVRLYHDALSELLSLQYLNIQNIRVIPFPNITSHHSLEQSSIHPGLNLTFLVPEDEEILPYNEYRELKTSSSSMFSHFNELSFLRLFRCHIDAVVQGMFDGLDNLKMLSLQNNSITKLPKYAFNGISRLRSLILSQNQIEFIHSESLSGLHHLENLDLSGNQLKMLSNENFTLLPKLNSLNLLNNPLESLSGYTFENVNTIQTLRIGSTRGLVVHENAFVSLNKLETLILLGLNLSELHKGVLRGLPNLKQVHIAGTIKSLAFDTFTGSPLVEEIILRHCSMETVSVDAFYGLERLKHLDLSHNKLETLQPGTFDHLHSLKELIITHNHFIMLPRLVLANLQRVDMIRLEANPWNCSCDMVQWKSLKLGMRKVLQTTKQPCTYQYDKIPCSLFVQTEIYKYDSELLPTCETPVEYHGWNVLRAVNMNKECAGEKRVFEKEAYKKKFNNSRERFNIYEEEAYKEKFSYSRG